MQTSLFVLFGLVALPCFAVTSDDAKNRPVSKVITLLKDMVETLEKEGKEDEEIYEAMSCWCTTNDKEKTKAIADGETKIGQLEAFIEEAAANSARLNTEIATLEKEVAENTEALEKATAMRQKELSEFNAEEKESLGTISSLKGAVAALSKHHEASFLQADTSTQSQLQTVKAMIVLKSSLRKHANLVAELFTPQQRRAITSFLHQSEEEGYNPEYAPASGEIFGLLKQMKEGFETNLANSQKEEMQSQDDYSNLKSAKDSEISAGSSLIETKTQELATTDEKHAQSIQDLEDTRNTLAADTKFLASLKEQCAMVDAEYEERTKTRQLEIQAVSKALAFLSSDEAQDLVSRTFSFIQVSKSTKRSAKVSKMLAQIAKKYRDPRLSTLAVAARLDAFTKVKKSIQDMVDKLVKEKEDEIAHKDFCVEELNTNEKETQEKNQEKNTLEANIGDLTEKMASLSKEIATMKAEISELQVELKRASEDREKENKSFQATVADQRATQKLLATALEILKGFYEKAALVQKRVSHKQPAGPPPPPGFKKQEPNAQSGGVMGMIEMIINDAKAMEADALKAEEDAQKAYESFVTETNDSITTNEKAIVHAEKAKAKAGSEKAETEEEKDAVVSELEALMSENTDLHKSCDYTLKNFDLRQTARDDEIEALKQAMSMLSGASFSAFLQHVQQ